MARKPPLARLESLIAQIVERPAWALSARRLHPLEISTALIKAMEARAVRLADRILVPDVYDVRLHPADLTGFGDMQAVLERELSEYLLRTFEERDVSCNLPPQVHFLAASEVRLGTVDVATRFTPPPEPAGTTMVARPARSASPAHPPRPSQPAPSIREGARQRPIAGDALLELVGPDGAVLRTFPLGRFATVIGRRSSTDVPLLDVGVSREHARIERVDGRYAIVDLGSTNGTVVNDEPVRGTRHLRAGDVVGIGRYRLRFVDGT